MRLWSDSWTNGDPIPERCAAGRPDGQGGVTTGENLHPHLAWSDVPEGAKSMVLICHDFDMPADASDVNRPGVELPVDLPRADFFHWVLVDLPPRPTVIAEGEYGRGFVPRGKPGPETLPLEGAFDGREVRRALAGRVLAEATLSGTYTLNPRLLGPA